MGRVGGRAMITLTAQTKDKPKADFRDATFGAIETIMRADANAIILTNDMGAMGFDKIAQFAQKRVINVGITEFFARKHEQGHQERNKQIFII